MKHFKLMATAVGCAVAGMIAANAQAMDMADEMAPVKIVDGAIPVPLTTTPGDPVRGRKIVIHRQKGNCLACHEMPIPEQQFHGRTGPALFGIGGRLPEAELRARIVDPKIYNPDTMMPSFYKVEGLHRVNKGFQNKTILSAQEVEDVVAYLKTLR